MNQTDLTFRTFESDADDAQGLELQRVVWGREFSDVVPQSLIKIARKIGGIAAGAFAPSGEIVGFVYGFVEWRGGQPAHWSHMLAVRPEARDLGLGRRLKLYQRELLLAQGIRVMRWTFDPLEARNAHLNLNRLGAEVETYVREMYADEMGSELAAGIGTDRLVALWRLDSERTVAAISGASASKPSADPVVFAEAPIVGDPATAADAVFPEAPRVRLAVPRAIQDLKADNLALGAAWRASTRAAFEHYFAQGYRVLGLVPLDDERRAYALEKSR